MNHSYNSPEEDKLIAAASNGDKAAFSQIVTTYEKLIYHTIRMKVGSAEDSLDLSQEVFIKLWRSIGKYRGDCRFSTWLYKIAVNTSLDFLRRSAHDRTGSLPTMTDEDDEEKQLEFADESVSASPDRTLDKMETVRMVRSAIEKLSDDQREIVILRDIEGYSYEEVAEMLELEIGTVKSRLNRARAHLRVLLSDIEEMHHECLS